MIYRRVFKDFYKPSKRYLSQSAFRPNRNDTDGLSIFLARYFDSPSDFLAKTTPADRCANYHVVQLVVAEITKLGLEVRFDAPPNGHALIVPLTFDNFQSKDLGPAYEAIIQQLAIKSEFVLLAPETTG